MNKRVCVALIVGALGFPGLARANGLFEVDALVLGLTWGITDVTVTRNEDGAEGMFESDTSVFPFGSILFSPTSLSDHTAFTFSASAFIFDMDEQVENQEPVDHGTSVKGYAATLTFGLSYLSTPSFENNFFQIGIEVGPGIIAVEGDIILDDGSREELDVEPQLTTAVAIFMRGRIGYVYIAVGGVGPIDDDGRLTVGTSKTTLDVGWAF